MRTRIWLVCLALLFPVAAYAHVGSPDIYVDGQAGPYKLFVTVRAPLVIPGVAEIEVRAEDGAQVSGIEIAPIPMVGEASKHPPVADAMKVSTADKQFYTGSLWIMASGSWQVRFTVHGSQGDGVLSIPVPATSSATLGMKAGLGTILSVLGLLLVVGVVGIVGAAARDSQLPAGARPDWRGSRSATIAMTVTAAIMVTAVVLGNWWWSSEAADYANYVYKPLTMTATVTPNQLLRLDIRDPGWLKSRKVDDFVLDHDHLMHLYLLRDPGLDVVYHLHPYLLSQGRFDVLLPSLPAGSYRVYADVVHATGFPETLTARIDLPAINGTALVGDDARGEAPALSSLRPVNGCTVNPAAGPKFALPDGFTMLWNNPDRLPAKSPQVFSFTLLDAKGNPPMDMTLYMGMVGHAAFVKDDGTVFAHVHPSGTASMAALMMAAAQNSPGSGATAKTDAMPGMEMSSGKDSATGHVPNSVGFPYGFPTAGAYRIFVQMKHGQTIETAAFDACATAPRRP